MGMGFRLGNAAGWIKNRDSSFEKLVRSSVTDVMPGSFTLKRRDGNPEPTYWSDGEATKLVSINSKGLPNMGFENARATCDQLAQMSVDCKKHGKAFRVSLAGFTPDEFETMTRHMVNNVPHDTIELNFGCPNVISEGKHKPIFSFSPSMIDTVIRKCAGTSKATLNLAVKVSPYSDPGLLAEVAAVINEHTTLVSEVVTCNTFPNAIALKDGKCTISGKGYGGLAGTPLKHIMLGQVAQFREHLDPMVEIIGVGGIRSGQDIVDALDAGAAGVQVGTAYFENDDPRIFSELLSQLPDSFLDSK